MKTQTMQQHRRDMDAQRSTNLRKEIMAVEKGISMGLVPKIVLTTLLLISMGFAQQPSSPPPMSVIHPPLPPTETAPLGT